MLDYWSGAVTSSALGADKTKYSLMIDVTNLNSAATAALTTNPSGWKGLQFGEKIGTWTHPTIGTFDASCLATGANDSSTLDCFDGTEWLGWDYANRTTTVPLPPSFALALSPLALLGFGAWRRRRQGA